MFAKVEQRQNSASYSRPRFGFRVDEFVVANVVEFDKTRSIPYLLCSLYEGF